MTDQGDPGDIEHSITLANDGRLMKVETDAGQGTQLIPSPTAIEIMENADEEPKAVFRAAIQLAGSLNDERILVAHLLVALTLTSRGLERLKTYNLDKETIRAMCWKELAPNDPPTGSVGPPALSDNVAEIIKLAEKRANDERSNTLSVDDVLVVLMAHPHCKKHHHYWQKIPSLDRIAEILKTVEALTRSSARIEESTGRVETNLARTEKRIATLKHIAVYVAGITSVVGLSLVASGGVLLNYFLRR